APAVEKKTTVARGYVPIALMHIGQTIRAISLENPIPHAPHSARGPRRVARQAAVLGLQPDDPIPKPTSSAAIDTYRAWRATVRSSHPISTTLSIARSEEHTSELQSQSNLVCRLLLEQKRGWRQRQMFS